MQAARPADLRHFRRQPARRRIAAAGSGAGRSRQAARRAGRRPPTRCARDDVNVTLDVRGRRAARLQGAGPRLAARPGGQQSDRQCALVLAAGRHRARHLPAAARARSRSWSMTTARASARTRSRRSSSASTPTGRTRASARIPGSACRSPSRSSKRMAARIRVENRTARRRPATSEPRVLGARFVVRLPAM